uniref:AGC/DMPK protein kinase n=1 Tax=Kwoniella bestiolae CBS 10118 TaxID=1296100 RepID=A0A1B9FUM6_9TREE|nr:AGC/DMPK protein kinase [Kwoniella bestiolae CBS 10118]OCF22469.1 AGC/DMPK protein kinase [Kwoniella bestiolae CBS 10118]
MGRLGDGQYGSVDAVQCKLDGQVYAMKTMPKHTIRRAGAQVSLELERHIHILAHSCAAAPIPKLFVAFQSQDSVSLVTSYAACGSLWDRLCSLSDEEDQAGHMSASEIQWWSPQMIVAIQWLHDQGYVHRDIKPHNFLITDRGRLLLTDFGSAAELHQPNQSSQRPFVSRDLCCLPIGTPDYIAPEVLLYAEDAFVQAADEDRTTHDPLAIGYDLSIDWWSFGATIYEMTTGKGPFWAPTIQQTYLLITQYEGNLQLPAPCDEGIRQLLQGYVWNIL